MPLGQVEAIWIAPVRRQPSCRSPQSARCPDAVWKATATFSAAAACRGWPGAARSRLADRRAKRLDAVLREHGIDLHEGRSRRNIETSGIVLAELTGRRFRIGTALLRGVLACQPCGSYLERLTAAGAMAALMGRGGLRAEVLEEGIIALGDAVEVLEE